MKCGWLLNFNCIFRVCRLTSGIVSPSELPDSPTQTVPPSPKPRKVQMDFPSGSKTVSNETRSQFLQRRQQKSSGSVFEDNLTKFKEESTPVQFSTATSLSSLTIDDEVDGNVSKESAEKESEKRDVEKEKDVVAEESEDEGDEEILAACINIGMQNNR